jgi:hypothetical protein
MKINATQNKPAQSLGGFPCPRCKSLIRFPFQALLTHSIITCAGCGLELQIDLARSATVLENLRKYVAGLDDAGRILDTGRVEGS